MIRSALMRFKLGSLCAVCLLVLGLAVAQQWSSELSGNDKVGDRDKSAKPGAAVGPEQPFKDWDNPNFVLVLTGGQHAYLEPCGCTENQTGGLARRADMFHQMWGKKWRTVALDVGSDLDPKRLSREQALLKLEFFRKALQHMRYSVYGLGREELRLGGDKLFELHSIWSSDEGFDTPFVSANVTLLSTRLIGTPLTHRIIEQGGFKIGVTSVIGKSRAQDLEGADPFILKIEDATAVLPGVIREMKAAQPNLLVLLVNAEDAESRELAKAFPEFHVVATAGGPEDPERKEQHVGNTVYVQVGRKGKHTACVGVFGSKAQPALKYELVEMNRQLYDNAPEMIDLMREYQQLVREQKPDSLFEQASPHKDTFVGVDQCKSCHTKAYDVWINSSHAHALASLTTGRADEKPEDVVDRQFDAECLACHVTGWSPQDALRFKGGFVDSKSTPHLANQQCENCHGPGGRHVQLETAFLKDKKETPELLKARAQVHETRDCEDCHDHENSPKFELERDAYWEQVKHPGKD